MKLPFDVFIKVVWQCHIFRPKIKSDQIQNCRSRSGPEILCGSSGSAGACNGNCVSSRRNTRKGMSSVFADIYFELPEPCFILSASKRYENIPQERCRICQDVLPLSQFHRVSRLNPNRRYACIFCYRTKNNGRYQRKKGQICNTPSRVDPGPSVLHKFSAFVLERFHPVPHIR